MTGQSPLLEISDLRVRFATHRGTVGAVDGVNLYVDRAEAVGIVGESGSGKSMTALAVVGLVPPPGRIASGDVTLNGRSVAGMSKRDLRAVRLSDIAMIFQDAGSFLNPIMRIEDQIAEAIGKHSSRDPEVRERVLQSLRDVRIADPERVARAYPHELSGGMQQRAMIASVLIRKPRLIIADEPTTALDATVQHRILAFLADLRKQVDSALVLISHDLAVIAQVCDRVYVMYAGQVVEEGATKTIFDAPRHPYTQALVSAILDPHVMREGLETLEGSPPDMAAPPPGCRFHPRCRYAFDRCRVEAPPLVEIGPGTTSRCWLSEAEGETEGRATS